MQQDADQGVRAQAGQRIRVHLQPVEELPVLGKGEDSRFGLGVDRLAPHLPLQRVCLG